MDHDPWQKFEPFLDQSLDLSDGERVVLPLSGFRVGPYTLERQLGQGEMGSVWLARRTDDRFEGYAAVKLLNLASLSPSGQERFRRERSVLDNLGHPGIARLLDAGVTATGQPYLIREYVEGQRIDVFARSHGLSRAERIALVMQVLSAVAHAHANLVVHCDIKPSNILVTREGKAKLLDFGIAKLLASEDDTDHASLAVDGAHELTPEFIAPEQARGDAITTATDVYAVGVLLYLLLSGRHPTADGSRSPFEALAAVFDVKPRRLGLGDLDNVVAKALQKAPELRYQSAVAFADDLGRYLAHEPVRAQPDSIPYRARKFVRRNRVPVVAAAATTVGLVAATFVSIDRMREARQQRDVAASIAVSLSTYEELGDEDRRLENLKRRREALASYQRMATLMDTTRRSEAMTRNVMQNNIGVALSSLGEMTAAERVLRGAVQAFLSGNTDGFVDPGILINYCRTLLFVQHLDSAALWYERLYRQSAKSRDAFMESEGASGMARVELARGRADAASRWIRRMKQADKRRAYANPNAERELAATAAYVRGDLARAMAGFDTTLLSLGYAEGKRTYAMRTVLVGASRVALDIGDAAKALEYARAAHSLAFSDPLSETRSAYVGESRLLEGRALLAAGDTVGARSALRRAVTALRTGVGAGHALTREAESVLALLRR